MEKAGKRTFLTKSTAFEWKHQSVNVHSEVQEVPDGWEGPE